MRTAPGPAAVGPGRRLEHTISNRRLALVGLALTASAADYGSLVNQGYRWVMVNGPYAYPSKEDAQNGGTGRKSESKQPVVHAYYLIPGMVVLVVETDSSTGLSRIRAGGISAELWTATKNLSTQPRVLRSRLPI